MKLRALVYRPYGRVVYDDKFMDAHADAYERKTRWTRMRLANVEELVEPQPGDSIIDLGCAAGSITHFLSTYGCDVVGVDYALPAIEHAQKLFPDLRFEHADCTALPFAAGSFEKIVAADLTEHLDDATLSGMFAECFRVLRPGGALSIHTPNPRHFIEVLKAKEVLLEQNPTHIGLRTRQELESGLRRSGFSIDLSVWRRSHIPIFRSFELLAGQASEFFRYRLCIRALKPAAQASASSAS